MKYMNYYHSPLGNILLAANDMGLTGLWFEGQKYYGRHLHPDAFYAELPIFEQTIKWLDIYFSGKNPNFSIPLHFVGSDFQVNIWQLLCRIPYGQTTTYGALAKQFAAEKGLQSMSAQAVGSAVGRNPISIMVPCHRVIGANGSFTGYAGGLDRKAKLLNIEQQRK